MHRPPAAESQIAEELAAVRPGLLSRYTSELPGARAAVLTRLWRALAHEPLPWLTGRVSGAHSLALRLADGRTLHGPHADPYATGAYVTTVRLDRERYDDPARLMTALGVPHGPAFAAELAHSTASLALSRAGADHPKEWPAKVPAAEGRRTDWEWEQRVVDGHPYHPNCRSRPGFSVADQLAYGPEHGPVVRLGTVPVPEADCLLTGDWPAELRDGDHLLLPVHPWQAEHVLRRPYDPWRPARPLMSLRTLALPGGPHVKTALSARLTSSVRDISVYSVRSAATLSDFAGELAARTDGLLHVTRTLGAATAGSPGLAALLREPPEVYAGPGEHVVPVAALATTSLPGSPAWLTAFTRLALTVGLRLLDLGVALEAHGQNLLAVLSADGTPLRLVYRDLADIRVSPARLARHGITPPALTGRLVTDDESTLRRKLFGSLVAGALAATAGSGPALATALRAALPDLPPGPDLTSLRDGPLPAKALTLMRLSPDRSGDMWTNLPHPRAVPAPGQG
ncbi:IucA/IucC family siderophore biosynthesis protein [Streptomyces sp. Go40/10]|uniref:IucA/IucC family siderophore biosynthesis protein n=1 Tax=Streptomyces sp. Go40/10 TaxID=2825844 RepID=UPI001E3D1B41|nr:IucA/IucC family siderophore biosynthesis protein [Streptomyces sp. Go40/10]UFR07329.1 IucA/IucC family siderophore biosynthesis protein [Streptomyces sp. Go40/10]